MALEFLMYYWLILIIAGICEVIWALGLKFSNGLTKPAPALVTVICMILSVYFLVIAAKQIPIGIAYAVWAGIGVIGTFLGNIIFFDEKFSNIQIMFFIIIVIGIVGLKLATSIKP